MEHAVDVVAHLEGDKSTQLRLLSCSKNRFGSTEELGVFDMTEKGLMSVENPNELFLTKRETPATGCALVSISEGSRVFVVEVQSNTRVFSPPFLSVLSPDKANKTKAVDTSAIHMDSRAFCP